MPLKSRLRSWKVPLVLTTSSFLLALGVSNIALKASFRLLDDGVYWESRNGRVVAKRMDPQGPAARAGIREGDVLVAVDDEAVDTADEIRLILDRTHEGQRLTYQVLREKERQAFAFPIGPLPRGNVGLYYFLAAVGIFSLVTGTAVYVRRRGVAATAHFYLLCFFWYLGFTFSFTGKLNAWDWTFYWLDRLGILFFPPIFLHFALCFPKRKLFVERRKWLLPLIYVPSFLMFYAAVLARLLSSSSVSWGGDLFFFSVHQIVDRVVPAFVAGMSLAAFAAFVNSHRSAPSITVRKQTQWIVWGTGFGTAPFAVFYALPYLIGWRPTLASELSVVPLALIPLSFAYAIVKYRLMDVEVLFKRGVVYTLATGSVIALYLTIVLAGTDYLVHDPHNTVIALLATMVVALLFSPIKSRIQVGIDRLFYRERFDYRRALLAFSRDLNAHLDLDHISARLVERIRDTFEVEKVALLVPEEATGDFAVLAGKGLTATERASARIPARSGLVSQLGKGESVGYGELDTSGLHAGGSVEVSVDRGPAMVEGLQCVIPCVVQGKVVGVLLLGRRRGESALSSEDTQLLLTLAGQAATALENARLYRSLQLKAEQFERLKEHNENIIESLDAGILVLDLAGKVARWNRSLETLCGLSREEALGQTIDGLFPASLLEVLRAGMGEKWWVRAEVAGISQVNLLNRQGENKVIKLHVAPFVSEVGETEGAVVILEDITNRVEVERQLRLREKMVSLGLLAAGVAHEVNTPLAGISSFAQMLLDQTPETDDRFNLLNKIEQQAERASRIVNSLLNFARQGRADFVPVDLNEVVTDVLSLLEHQLTRGRIKVRLELEGSLPRVLGDENKLQQVFLNLILNAHEAMPSGGWLTIRTSGNSGQVVADVSDTGHGISKDDIARIYDLFFTTKRGGRGGTGLGLSITYGIIQEHSGHISVESVVGQGTHFQIKLPTCEKMATFTHAAARAAERGLGAGRVRRS